MYRTTDKTTVEISQIIGLAPSFVRTLPHAMEAQLRLNPFLRYVVSRAMGDIFVLSMPPELTKKVQDRPDLDPKVLLPEDWAEKLR